MTPEPEAPKKVVTLRGANPPLPEVQQDIVDELERLLVSARDGQLIGFIYGGIYVTADIMTGWAGSADTHRCISAASILQHRLNVLNDETDDEC